LNSILSFFLNVDSLISTIILSIFIYLLNRTRRRKL